ncbi:UNVERIFIED_CONTAM: hypothetical protein FKN15_025980 [Acipenser sinensis]
MEDAVKQGHTKVSVRTVDTAVVILAVTSAQRLDIPEFWVAFGTGKNSPNGELTKWPGHCVLTDVFLCQCSMHSLGVTQCYSLEAGGRRLHGTHGKPMMRSHQHSVLWVLHQTP